MDPRTNTFYLQLRCNNGYNWNRTRTFKDKLTKANVKYKLRKYHLNGEYSYIFTFDNQQDWDTAWDIKENHYKPQFNKKESI